MIRIKFKKLDNRAVIPKYQTKGSAAFDFHAVLNESVTLAPLETKLIPTGLAYHIQDGYEIQVRPRSGLSLKGYDIANSPGTLDSDYKGEIGIIVRNLSNSPITVEHGMRLAQGKVSKAEQAKIKEVQEFDENEKTSTRGTGGFGSTGLK